MSTRPIVTSFLVALALAQSTLACSKPDAPKGDPTATPGASAKPVDPAAPCPATFLAIPNQATVTHFACTCKPGAPNGPVWGKGPFSKDSAICAAGTFVSAVSLEQGGQIDLSAGPACSAYEAAPAVGGVTPQKKGKLDQGSFCVDRFGGCDCK